ncbi:MAG TPA: protein tyrosine phosphatase family protein [Myxococcales bacterium]|jgi:uncharacterized protein (TIGR01244 family)
MNSPIENFQVINDRLATAAQPAAEDFAWLREQGFEAVINLSTPTARNFVPEESKLALESGMAYVHAPVDCSELTPEHYKVVRGLLEAFSGRKVLLHCAGNVKSSGLAHIYRVHELKEDRQRLRAELENQGWHEPKWFKYFDQLGA